MSRTANLSILGLYQWDNSLFDLMQLPSGVDRGILIDNLLAETAELECLYADPLFLKAIIARWSAKQLNMWTKL